MQGMNIDTVTKYLFCYAGELFNRDLETKTTMLVKNFDDTKWNKKKQPLPTIAMEKLDGVCTLAICIEGRTRLFSRTGRKLKNVEHLEGYLSLRLRGNHVMMMELCHPHFELEEISGICNPNRVDPLPRELAVQWRTESYLGIYDLISLDEFMAGTSTVPYQVRLENLVEFVADRDLREVPIPRYVYCTTEEQVKALLDTILSEGGEGIVRCLPEGHWQAGYKNHDKTKQVGGVDFDLEVIGVEIGTKGKHKGVMNKLIVRWKEYGHPEGKLMDLPVDGRFDYATRQTIAENQERYIGQIVHVHALKIGSKGSLRLAKVRTFRVDKTTPDF